MSVRKPVVAGQFYPGTAEGLKKSIQALIDPKAKKKDALGVILPHAGYIYSAGVAAAVISRLNNFKTYIIIGPNHTGLGPAISVFSGDAWQTPLGEVKINKEIASEILAEKIFTADITAHEGEHSVEVELPLLQFGNREFDLVPIVVGTTNLKLLKEAGSALAWVVKKHISVLIVASSDMTHYESQKIAQEKDRLALDAVLRLDEDLLMQRVHESDISMCGYGPVAMMLSCVKQLGATKAELVKYQTSGDVTGDYSAVVGYAGVIVN